MQELIAAVRAHALANYESDGWDFVVEAFDDEQVADAIGTARTARAAIKNVARAVRDVHEYRSEAQASAW